MGKELYLNQVDFIELKSLIKNAVQEVLDNGKTFFSNEKEGNKTITLSRKQTASFLKISLTTLWDLDRKGKLPSRRINSKVYYLKADLINFLNQAA